MADLSYQRSESSFSNLPHISENWRWFLTLGILMVILGIFAIWFDVFTTMVTVTLLGGVLSIGGLIVLTHAALSRRWSGFFMNLLLGLLYLVLGFLMIRTPGISAISLTLLMAAFFISAGLFRIIAAAVTRFEHWGWFLASGILTLLLGIFIWLQWPITGLFIIGLFVGIELIMSGWTYMTLALSARRYHHPRPV